MSHLITAFIVLDFCTLKNCCSTRSVQHLPTGQFLGHFLRVDSQCLLTGAGIALTSRQRCCVTQVNSFLLAHLACDLANALRSMLVKSSTPVANDTSGALR